MEIRISCLFLLGIEIFNTERAYCCYCTFSFSPDDVLMGRTFLPFLSRSYVPCLEAEMSHKRSGMILLAHLYQTHAGRVHDTKSYLRQK